MRFLKFILIVLLFSVVIASCQKDQAVDLTLAKTGLKADTSNNSGNFFAVSGTLNITVGDTTYTFDAAKDSVAFINANIDSNKYFGITAINKAHTMSFGISSPGFASPDLTNAIAGGQLLFSKHGAQFTLAKDAEPNDSNKITLEKYMQDSILTKGTFSAVMTSQDGKQAAPASVTGEFNLRIK
ncbi:MAG: hypothetical protein JWQ34_1744 [Mucilaginibacter sp.]|uniref:hypothetical protein n=1 Tax=Mucilaginibacter sp. TaxID=1882438 RepID=UPI0026030F2A|nr:hypothetical protein [Mucilaginibacter sp.]MDB5003519.1 hypothetical protein [Mucilaginibacter sp.]